MSHASSSRSKRPKANMKPPPDRHSLPLNDGAGPQPQPLCLVLYQKEPPLRKSPRPHPEEPPPPRDRKRRQLGASGASLRRSPRFFVTPEVKKLRNTNKNLCSRGMAFTLRRSPRFFSAPGEGLGLDLAVAETQKGVGGSLTLKKGMDGELDYFNTRSSTEKVSMKSMKLFSSPWGTESSRSEVSFQMSPTLVLKSPEKSNCASVSPRSLNSKLMASREFESKLLFLTWHDEDDREPLLQACCDSNINEEKCLRRSPRFTSTAKNAVNGESARMFNATSQEEKQLRRPPKQLCTEKVITSSHFCELSCNPDRQLPKRVRTISENPNIEVFDGKCSRQPPGNTKSLLSIENSEVNHVLTELPESNKEEALSKTGNTKQKTKPYFSEKKDESICCLFGDPVPSDEAKERWHWRYELKSQKSNQSRCLADEVEDDEDKIIWNVECHYSQADIAGTIFSLGDCAYVKGEGSHKHIGRIIEFFRTTEREDYFRVQWFYKAEETVMKEEAAFHDKRRVFYSTIMNDNPIDCIISKVTVTQIPTRISSRPIPKSDFYYDMEYCVEYSTFRNLLTDNFSKLHDSSPSSSINSLPGTSSRGSLENTPCEIHKAELALLDLFSGCGGMSTGLCLGARVSGVDLVTRWALDSDKSACESLKLNHPETHVRNEAAEDFLKLLKEWKKLCDRYAVDGVVKKPLLRSRPSREPEVIENSSNDASKSSDEFEVSRLLDICYGDPDESGERGLKFKVRWKGYDSSEDTWEPIEGLSNCQECIQDFVRNGFKSKILPLPGDVDVICGGPPCQGISGYNRFRNVDSPLADERNHQIVVFMDIVQFLKPKFVLMENVLDILRFNKGSLGRYALSRLVHMKYQSKCGIMAAGCYGLPQFRLRVFLWGADTSEKLPPFPLPTHDVIMKYWPPPEFERNIVAYGEDQPHELEKAAVLWDAISDLPNVTSHENREEMAYENPPHTGFQTYIRSSKLEIIGAVLSGTASMNQILYDHRPGPLTEEDYARVCHVPKRKGANFRDLPGVVVGTDNIVRRDPTTELPLLPSGKPFVPDFAFTFEQGKSKRPYARLWWDETVSTIVTYPNLHSQAVVHPEQDRVLTLRECARLQGFPDYYRFCGTVKERYRQVGNAVAVPVARALGYALGMAFQKLGGDDPAMKLPPKFAYSTNLELTKSLFHKAEED